MVSEKILTTILNGGGDNNISDKNDDDNVDGDDHIYLLLIGNHQSGKTSIAFNLAYNIALNGGKPLYICNQIKLESKLPLTIYNSDQHLDSILMHTTNTITTNSYEKKRNYNNNSMLPEVLQRINMKYITTIQDLKALIAGLHLFEPRPSVVIIDDLSILIDPLQAINRNDGKFLEIVLRLTSYLQDAMKFLATIIPSVPADISATTSIATNVINHSNLSNNDDRVSNAEDNSKSSSTTRRSDRCSDVSRLKVIITDSCRDKLYLQLLSKTMTTILSLQSMPIDQHHTTSLHSTSNRASTAVTTTTTAFAAAVSLTLLKAADHHLCDAAAAVTTTSSTTAATTMMSPSSSSSSSLSLQLLYSNNSLYVVIN